VTIKLSVSSYLGLGFVVALALGSAGCSKSAPSEPPPATAGEAQSAPATAAQPAAAQAEATAKSVVGPAEVGKPAPEFSLKSLDGKDVNLSDFKGKTVVLEWFNPQCPFVRLSHTVGSLKGLADKYTKDGVVWLAINSGAPGKQGAGEEATRNGIQQFGMDYPVLLDDSGKVGHQYGAERTPHLFVINPEGVLVYKGAIDNSPDGEGKSPEGGKLVNYVDNAIGAVKTGAKVEPAETKAYGCGVKYSE
jgi:peroxiredoxin